MNSICFIQHKYKHKHYPCCKDDSATDYIITKKINNNNPYAVRYEQNILKMKVNPLYSRDILNSSEESTTYKITIHEVSTKVKGLFDFLWLDRLTSLEEKCEHLNIQFMLMKAYQKHEKQFEKIITFPVLFESLTKKKYLNYFGVSVECSDVDKFIFMNRFLKNGNWICTNNEKFEQWTEKNSIYFSNVFCYQFKKFHESHQLPMRLPKIITRENIRNTVTCELIEKCYGKIDHATFTSRYLKETVNGKSTVRLAELFGLKITKVIVTSNLFSYSVITHVEPDGNSFKCLCQN